MQKQTLFKVLRCGDAQKDNFVWMGEAETGGEASRDTVVELKFDDRDTQSQEAALACIGRLQAAAIKQNGGRYSDELGSLVADAKGTIKNDDEQAMTARQEYRNRTLTNFIRDVKELFEDQKKRKAEEDNARIKVAQSIVSGALKRLTAIPEMNIPKNQTEALQYEQAFGGANLNIVTGYIAHILKELNSNATIVTSTKNTIELEFAEIVTQLNALASSPKEASDDMYWKNRKESAVKAAHKLYFKYVPPTDAAPPSAPASTPLVAATTTAPPAEGKGVADRTGTTPMDNAPATGPKAAADTPAGQPGTAPGAKAETPAGKVEKLALTPEQKVDVTKRFLAAQNITEANFSSAVVALPDAAKTPPVTAENTTEQIRTVQRTLNADISKAKSDLRPLNPDGMFGPKTLAAISAMATYEKGDTATRGDKWTKMLAALKPPAAAAASAAPETAPQVLTAVRVIMPEDIPTVTISQSMPWRNLFPTTNRDAYPENDEEKATVGQIVTLDADIDGVEDGTPVQVLRNNAKAETMDLITAEGKRLSAVRYNDIEKADDIAQGKFVATHAEFEGGRERAEKEKLATRVVTLEYPLRISNQDIPAGRTLTIIETENQYDIRVSGVDLTLSVEKGDLQRQNLDFSGGKTVARVNTNAGIKAKGTEVLPMAGHVVKDDAVAVLGRGNLDGKDVYEIRTRDGLQGYIPATAIDTKTLATREGAETATQAVAKREAINAQHTALAAASDIPAAAPKA